MFIGRYKKILKLDNYEGLYLYKFKPSIFELVPYNYKNDFPTINTKLLLFRLLTGGYLIYYISDKDKLYAYDFIKKNYFNKYKFMHKNDVISNPNYVAPSMRGKGFAQLIFKNVISDKETRWNNLWGVIKSDNVSSIKAVEKTGWREMGYAKRKKLSYFLTNENGNLKVYCYKR